MAFHPPRRLLRHVVMTTALVLLVAAAPGVSASSSTAVSFEKMCTPDLCTVTASSSALIPVGSTLTYNGPRFDPHLSSGFVLDTGTGTANGHCTLSWTTGLGHCSLGDGTGTLGGVHAVFSESVDFADGTFENFVFRLVGAYHID